MFLRIVVAGAFFAAVAWPVWKVIDDAIGQSLPAQIVSLGLGLTLGIGAYLGVCAVLGLHELQALLSFRGRRT